LQRKVQSLECVVAGVGNFRRRLLAQSDCCKVAERDSDLLLVLTSLRSFTIGRPTATASPNTGGGTIARGALSDDGGIVVAGGEVD
jgi:hypothetical protein